MSTPQDFVSNRNFFKRNYHEAIESFIPDVYMAEDINLSGVYNDPLIQLTNSLLYSSENFLSLLNVSTLTATSVIKYFIPQNNLTYIGPFEFERDILFDRDVTLSDFATEADFIDYLSGTLLPNLNLNQQTLANHRTLISDLTWFYFLNTSGVHYDPSSYVLDSFLKLYRGETLKLSDGIKGLVEYTWKNQSHFLSSMPEIYINQYLSGTGTYTSGTQQLDKLKTLVGVLYDDNELTLGDTFLKNAFNDFESLGTTLESKISQGPLGKFVQAASWSLADSTSKIEGIKNLYNIERCPDHYLPYIADLIGWKLIGFDSSRWRLQLRKAVEIYKSKGTKRSIQLMADTIFAENALEITVDNLFGLYESYLPNLIYYLLATQSEAFSKGLETYTRDVSTRLGVLDYSYIDVDTNIRFAVDSILFKLYLKYPEVFLFGNTPFPIYGAQEDFIFFYRGRDFRIPPWEEEKFYKNSLITGQVLDFIVDELKCFGVKQSIREAFKQYIIDYTYNTSETIYANNRWLFFTSSMTYPPNMSELLFLPTDKKIELLPYWNSKSSHFALLFEASSFDFTDVKSNTNDDALVVDKVAQSLEQVIPINAIPLITLSLSSQADIGLTSEDCGEQIRNYYYGPTEASTPPFFNWEVSAYNFSAFNHSFSRASVDDLSDLVYSASSPICTSAPRNSYRRRDYRKTIPTEGYFDRTGFNQPSPYLFSSISYNNYNKLGYIPSANMFQDITDYDDIHPVYGQCENINSSSVYFGIPVSTTFVSRGIMETDSEVLSSIFRYRGETPDIIALIHEIYENEAYLRASAIYDISSVYYGTSANIDFTLASANLIIQEYSATNLYENFRFGLGVHKLFNDYYSVLGEHDLAYDLIESNRIPNIFSHAYGPLLMNNDFDLEGSALLTSSNLIGSSLVDNIALNDTVLSSTNIGSTLVSSNFYVEKYEYVNPHIISGVELVMPSGVDLDSGFTIINLSPEFIKQNGSNFAIDNTLIKLKSIGNDAVPRVRLNLKSYFTTNYLIPEHDFTFKVKCAGVNSDASQFGGVTIGVLIRTQEEDDYVWVWTKENIWERLPVSIFNSHSTGLGTLLDKSHNFVLPIEVVTPSQIVSGVYDPRCFELDETSISTEFNGITSSIFKTVEISFNTKNLPIAVPDSYYRSYEQVHRNDQDYYFEVFMVPNIISTNRSLLVEEVFLRDDTQYERTQIPNPIISGVYNLTAEQLRTVLQFFKELKDYEASRYVPNMRGVFGVSGGGRLSYRQHPYWSLGGVLATYDQVSSINLQN